MLHGMKPKSPHAPLLGPVPFPEQYTSFRVWLRRCLRVLRRAHGDGTMSLLAYHMGCSKGHLSNILKDRPLRTPFLENLAVAFGLPERQVQILRLQVLAEHGRGKARERAQRELEKLLSQRARKVRRIGPRNETPATQLTLEALSEAGALTRNPRALAVALWPRATVTGLGRMTLGALSEWARPERLGVRPFSTPGTEELGFLQDVLRRGKMALKAWPQGLRLMLASVWLVPEEGWEWGLAEETEAFWKELRAWAVERRARTARCRVQHIHLQATPLSANLTGSAGISEGGVLRIVAETATKEEEGASSSSMLDPGPSNALPSTFAFDDYREFLRVWFQRKQAMMPPGRSYTQGMLAKVVRCNQSQISKLVVKGSKDKLPEHHVESMAKALKLPGAEAEDFVLLVRYTHATDPVTRALILRDRMALPGFREGRPVVGEAMAIFSSPVHVALFELARHPDFKADPDWIAGVLTTGDPSACALALRDLVSLGALVSDAAGVPRPASPHIYLEAERRRELLHAHHISLLEHAAQMIAVSPACTRHADLALLIPNDAVDELAEKVRGFHRRVEDRLQVAGAADSAGPRALRLVTLQVFPGTETLPFDL